MKIPDIPQAITNDPDHSTLVIIGLVVLVGFLGKIAYDASIGWKKRMEQKLDMATAVHQQCRQELPEKYLTKKDFEKIFGDFLQLRSKEWKEFRDLFQLFANDLREHIKGQGLGKGIDEK